VKKSASRCLPLSLAFICGSVVWLCPAALGQPAISAVVNSASYEAELAPGCWMTIFGVRLAPGVATAPAPEPLPTTLLGVRVTLDGLPVPLAYVSDRQINGVVPFEVQMSGAQKSVAVTVTTAEGTSSPHQVLLKAQAPALFTRDQSGKGAVIAIAPSFDRLLDSVQPGETMVLYAAGLGQTDPPARSDSGGARAEPYNRVPASRMPAVLIGDRPAEVLFAGLAPGWPGIYQLNVRAQDRLDSDRVVLRSAGTQSNITSINVPPGQNALNVAGSIASLFPGDGSDPNFPTESSPFDRSVMPQVVRFSVSLEVASGARPFSILATGEAGYARIEIDPPNGTWQAELTVPDAAVQKGDYSAVGFVYDYRSCNNALVCFPFPAGVVPMSRLYKGEVFARAALPLPNRPGSGGLAFFTASGALPATRRFVIDATTNSSLSTFGGLTPIPLGYLDTRTLPLRLYVDGRLIASKDVAYKVVTRPVP
jgi:uncharacterized protein (TIGR03437 family)